MYQNQNERLGIDFEVERLDFSHREALDPRIVRIAPNKRNEYHKHAHESLFVILSGRGLIIIDSEEIEANQGDVLFVPRWVFHQTVNASSTEDLVLLAVTDFGLTSSVLGDYDKRTRLQDGGIDVKGGAPHTPSDQEGRRQGEKV
jgi:hypothetical protein